MKKAISLACAVLLASLSLAGCSNSEVAGKTTTSGSGVSGALTFAGSSSMAPVVEALGEEFRAQNTGVTVTVGQQGSGSAITALNDGTAQIGNLSRDVKNEENADGKYEVIRMAIDGIAVVVNPKNPVTNLTLEQIASIFKGEITNWKDVGGDDQAIYVVGREEGSGTRDGFESVVKVANACKYGVLLKETGDVVSKVSSEKAAIGYISYASLNTTVKDIVLNGVKVSDDTIKDGTYKLQRPFVMAYRKGTNDKLTLAFLDFLKTDKAQSIIKGDKLIPVEF